MAHLSACALHSRPVPYIPNLSTPQALGFPYPAMDVLPRLSHNLVNAIVVPSGVETE